jgi:hypothetical protein
MLREQAFTLTTLAPSFDIQAIQGRLLDVAARCEELANRMEEEHRQAVGFSPSASLPDLH